MLKIKIYVIKSKSVCDKYMVFLNDHSWSMSEDADMPNGVCMTSDITEQEFKAVWHNKYTEPKYVPKGVAKQIAYLAYTYSIYIQDEEETEDDQLS